jgi:DDE superfamily endonuclease
VNIFVFGFPLALEYCIVIDSSEISVISHKTTITTNEMIEEDYLSDRVILNSTNTIDHLESLKSYTMKNEIGLWKRLILIWDNASFHLSEMVMDYINTQKEEDWLNIIHLPKKAPYLNPNEKKVNQQIKSNICANRFYDYIKKKNCSVRISGQKIWKMA